VTVRALWYSPQSGPQRACQRLCSVLLLSPAPGEITVAHGHHARGRSRPHAPTVPERRRRDTYRRPIYGMPAALAGTAVLVAAAVGGLSSVSAQGRILADSPTTAPLQPQILALDAQLRQLRDVQQRAAHEQAVRASRERARLALLDKRRKRALAARKQAQARRQAAQRARLLARSYVLPLQNYRLTARFGAVGLWSNGHTGLDFAAPSGTPVRAVAAGRVMSAKWAGAYGWQVIVVHAGGTQTWYCHLSSMSVRTGTVQAGEVIGHVGSTGNTTGPHLHLEVRVGGQPIDPAGWLRAHGVTP